MVSVVIGSDHGAFSLKEELREYLLSKKVKVFDVGPAGPDRCDYPDKAEEICQHVLKYKHVGIALCGTGIGISIACNKFNGIRCALCHDHYTASMARQHNDANVLALGGRVTGPEVAKEIVDAFLGTAFLGDRHAARLDLIAKIEKAQKTECQCR